MCNLLGHKFKLMLFPHVDMQDLGYGRQIAGEH